MSDDIVPSADLPVDVPVYTKDGHHLGTVKAVYEHAFKVAAPLRPDYWLSTEAIESVEGGRYTLSIESNRLHDYRVRDPHREDDDDPGGITGRIGVLPTSTAAAGLLVPDNEDRGSDPGGEPS
jgi:hypothetical protein